MNEKQHESSASHLWMGLVVFVMLQAAFNLYLMKSMGDIQNGFLALREENFNINLKRYRRNEPVVSFTASLKISYNIL
jgi:hypothetical protein